MAARKWHGSNSWIRKDKRFAIYNRDHFACCYCGQIHTEEVHKHLSLDHVVAHHNGGSNHETNLVTCCQNCNSRKQEKDLHEFVDEAHAKLILGQINKPIDRPAGKRLAALHKAVRK